MTLAQALIAFTSVAVIFTLVPGLDSLLVLRNTLALGRRHAVATGIGIALGLFIWGAAAAIGAAALLTASQVAFRVLTWIGAAYMIGLGLQMLIRSFMGKPGHCLDLSEPESTSTASAHAQPPGDTDAVAKKPRSPWRSFLIGLSTDLVNPKAGAFYVAIIPQFMADGVPPLAMGLMLAGIHVLACLVWFAVIIAAASKARRFLTSDRASRWIDRAAGAAIVGFGIKVGTSTT